MQVSFPAGSPILPLRVRGGGTANTFSTHSATFCNHPSNSPVLKCCKWRFGEFVQQITLSHPCNKQAEFRAPEKALPAGCWLPKNWQWFRLGLTQPWERQYPQAHNFHLAPLDDLTLTHEWDTSTSLKVSAESKSRDFGLSSFQNPTIYVFTKFHSTPLQSPSWLEE